MVTSTRPVGPLVIDIENITKDYVMGEETVHALRGVSLQIHKNEYIAIMGPSGSGKSTLMNMLGCLDTPTSGRYEFNGKNVAEMNDDELAAIRNREIGFVFQTFNLLPRSTSLRNVELPLIYAGIDPDTREEMATHVLHEVGLGDRMNHKPNELSGGQRQRVAVARALVNKPSPNAMIATAAAPRFVGRGGLKLEGALDFFEIDVHDQIAADIGAKVDQREGQTPGAKFYHWERRGVPVVLELGPRDVASGNIVLKRRDTGTKEILPQAEIAARVPIVLEQMQRDLYAAARKRLSDNTLIANSINEVEDILRPITAEKGGGKFVMAHMKDDPRCDARVKEFKATIRCIPLEDQYDGAGKCVVTGEPVARRVVIAKSY